MRLKEICKVLLGVILGAVVVLGPVVSKAQSDPQLSLSVSNSSVKIGDTITYNISYSNVDGGDLSSAEIVMDLPVNGGLSFMSSSRAVEWTSNNNPKWRLGDLVAGGSGVVSLTVLVSGGYEGSNIVTSATLDALGSDSASVGVGSGSTSVVVDSDKGEDEKEESEKKDDDKKKDDSDLSAEDDKDTGVGDLEVDGVRKIDVEKIVGGADMSEFENVNKWDSRFLVVGVVALVLILV
ncbi:DUF11 domain-containing protein, partial [Patescibacteria group bacterium]|nr:DUF11 domain-containing protein [Patescibacteria group bacterium]